MTAIGGTLTQFFTLILKPFEAGHAFAGIIFISVVTGAVMLVLFKFTSNQRAMKEVKTKIGAYFLEMRLYKDDVSTVMASQRRILWANLIYTKLALLPAVVMMVPVILIMVQLNLRYAHTGLRPGDTALVKVTTAEGVDVVGQHLSLDPGDGIDKASPAVRIPSLGEVSWKIRLADTGVHTMRLTSDAGEVTLPVFGTKRLVPAFASFKPGSFWESLLNPGSPAIPASMQIESIEIQYPEMAFNFGLFHLSWLWTFLVVSMAFGLVLKLIFKVE